MRNKVLSFIYSRKNNKWLLLKNNPVKLRGFKRWFTVTGTIEENENLEQTVAKELLEEINIAPIKIITLNNTNKYLSKFDDEECIEYNFLSIINSDKIELDNIENIDYLWVDFEEFIEKLWWYEDKDQLKEQLLSEINNLNITKENIDNTYLPYGKVVEVYVLNEKKEFVIVFSALKDRFCKVLSGGVEKGESFEEAAIREVKEEIGADIEILAISKYPCDFEISKESLFNNYFKSRGGKGKIIISKIVSPPENIKIQEEEISGYKWIRKEEIKKYFSLQEQIDSAEKIFDEFKDYF